MSDGVAEVGKKLVSKAPEVAALLAVVAGFLYYMDRQTSSGMLLLERQGAAHIAAVQATEESREKIFEKMSGAIDRLAVATDKNTGTTLELSAKLSSFLSGSSRAKGGSGMVP